MCQWPRRRKVHGSRVDGQTSTARKHPVVAVGLLVLSLAIVAVRAVGVQQSVERARAYWAEPVGDPGGVLYVALGDSAAQGVGATSPDRGYVGLLAERLRQSTGRAVQVVNLSVSGARVADVVEEQLPQLDGLAPDVVTVAIGGNDVPGYEPGRFAADVDRLVAGLPPGTSSRTSPTSCTAAGGRAQRRQPGWSERRPRRPGWSSFPSTTG